MRRKLQNKHKSFITVAVLMAAMVGLTAAIAQETVPTDDKATSVVDSTKALASLEESMIKARFTKKIEELQKNGLAAQKNATDLMEELTAANQRLETASMTPLEASQERERRNALAEKTRTAIIKASEQRKELSQKITAAYYEEKRRIFSEIKKAAAEIASERGMRTVWDKSAVSANTGLPFLIVGQYPDITENVIERVLSKNKSVAGDNPNPDRDFLDKPAN